MRILVLAFEDIYNPSGGLGVHCRDLYKAMGELGHEIVIVGLSEDGYGISNPFKNVEFLKIYDTNTFNDSDPVVLQLLYENNFLINILEFYGKQTFDVIHCHDAHLWKVADNLRALWKIPIVITLHLANMMHNFKYNISKFTTYKAQIEGTALSQADAIITVSEYYRDKLLNSVLQRDSYVIHNGIDIDALRDYVYDEEIRKKFLEDKQKLITLVGRPVEDKGILLFQEVSKIIKNYKFILISYLSDSTRNFYPLAKHLEQSQSDNFIWLSNTTHDENFRIMASSDIGIVPSMYEPFGIVALEWMALKIPLITTGAGGLAEFCNKENSILIKPTTDSMIDAILKFEKDNNKIINAFNTAINFNWNLAARKTVNVYENLRG